MARKKATKAATTRLEITTTKRGAAKLRGLVGSEVGGFKVLRVEQGGVVLKPRGYSPEVGRGLERMIDAARQHGVESETDHEVGDLQEILRACWEYLPAPARSAVCARFAELVTDFLDEDPDNTIVLRPEDFQHKVAP